MATVAKQSMKTAITKCFVAGAPARIAFERFCTDAGLDVNHDREKFRVMLQHWDQLRTHIKISAGL